jgi:Zn-dependent protease with chaperone function
MATVATGTTGGAGESVNPLSRDELSREWAMRQAWKIWLTLLITPFILVLVALMRILWSDRVEAGREAGTAFFLIGMLYLTLAIPASYFLRGKYFARYYRNHTVAPKNYLKGMAITWGAAVVGGLISVVGIMVNKRVAPEIIPGMVALVFYCTTFPNGRAMTRPIGGTDDHGVYKEPR